MGTEGVEVNSALNNITSAVKVAQGADAVVLFVGIDGKIEGEEHDRSNCTFPGLQQDLIQAITALNKPTVMVLIHGGVMCLGTLKDSVPAIVDAFYGGERGAEAIAAVLFGDYNPSGKLPVTMYPPEYMFQNPLTQMSVTAPPGRTHLYYTGKPEFAFGTGLSYSQWAIEVESADREIGASQGTTSFSVKLTNKGPMDGQQRVLAYLRPRSTSAHATAPRQRLWSYKGAHLQVGDSTTFSFQMDASMLAQSNEIGDRVVYPGEYEVAFSDGVSEAKANLRITGKATTLEKSVFRNAKPTKDIFNCHKAGDICTGSSCCAGLVCKGDEGGYSVCGATTEAKPTKDIVI